MKKLWFILLLLLPVAAAGQEASLQFEQANGLYRSGSFEKAAELYEQILKNGYESPALYYNLGNAYFKLQNIPAAILAYERARRLAPHDEDILYNLRLANLRVVDKIEPLPQLFLFEWWGSFVSLLTSERWGILAIAGLWIAVIAATLYRVARGALFRRMAFLVCGVMMLFSILAFVGGVQRHHAEQSASGAIVFAQSVSVKSAPDAQSTDLFVLHEGVKVDVMDNVGEWRKIRLADGKEGWVVISSIQLI
ncbi:MAG TPA: tetratricopeptide repeat protein [Bacteroidota bacterium]|nr:tetratricopeptide repeat protein [Bacteroidota bacterium]